jgi:hypothetical protein
VAREVRELNDESTQCQHQEPLPNETAQGRGNERPVLSHRLVDGDHQVERLKNSIKSPLRVLSWFDVCARRFCRNGFTPEKFGCQFGPPLVIRLQSLRLTFLRARTVQACSRLELRSTGLDHGEWAGSACSHAVFMLLPFPLFDCRVRTAD